MKKLFIPLVVFVLSLPLQSAIAQTFIEKGSIAGGGGFEFTTGTSKSESGGSSFEDSETSIALTPFATYYIVDNLGLGAMINVSSSKSKDKDSDFESGGSTLSIGPLVRYYFAEGPFAQAFLGVGSGKSRTVSGGSEFESKYSLTRYELGAGYSIRLTDTILLDPMVGYQGVSQKNKDTDAKNSYGGLFLRVGFTMILIQP